MWGRLGRRWGKRGRSEMGVRLVCLWSSEEAGRPCWSTGSATRTPPRTQPATASPPFSAELAEPGLGWSSAEGIRVTSAESMEISRRGHGTAEKLGGT